MVKWMSVSLGRKLSIIIMISTLVPLLCLGVFTYSVSSILTEEKVKQSGIDTLKQMEDKLSFIVDDIENISLFMIGQNDIQQFLSMHSDDNGIQTRILDYMMNLSTSKKYILNISLYAKNVNTPLSNSAIYSSTLSNQLDLYQVTEKMWTEIYTVSDFSGQHQVISLIRPMRSVYTYETLGWLVISVDEKVISSYWSEANFGDGKGQIALLNERGKVISSTEKEWLEHHYNDRYPGIVSLINDNPYGEITYGKGAAKHTILYYKQQNTDWTFIGMIPYDWYSAQNRFILILTAVAVLISIIINVGLVLFVIQRVTNPLRKLTRLLTKVNTDDLMPEYHLQSQDEIGRLGESYNKLGLRIKELKKQLIRDETRKKEADIRALQAQINPHFLYNTLSSIHWMALMSEEKRISDMVGALSDLLQFSLNKGNEFCPVHQEIAHIRNYTEIQEIRFPGKFDVDIIVDPNLQDKFMLKLLLQPLIENAMLHGIQKKSGKGTIGIYIEQEGNHMNFLVIDDGIGMTDERLQDVRNQLEESSALYGLESSYGLRNVNERLRLNYGPLSCLIIESRPNHGTRISFSIPFLEGPKS